MIISIILGAILLFYLAVSVLWAVFLRKLSKTRLRFFCVAASFVVALIATFITKSFLEGESFAVNTVIPLLAAGNSTVAELFANSDALRQTLIGVVTSLAAPILFLVFFLVANFLSWIAYLLINLIQSSKKNAKKEKKAKKAKNASAEAETEAETEAEPAAPAEPNDEEPLAVAPAKPKMKAAQIWGTIGFAVGKTFLVFFVWMIPVITYVGLVPAALGGIMESSLIGKEDRETLETVLEEYVEPVQNSPIVVTYRFLGGDLVSHGLTTFRVGEEFIDLTHEVGSISKFGGHAMDLLETDLKDFDEEDMRAFDYLSESFEESHTLPPILDEILYDATGAWMEGEAYLGLYFDSIRFDEEGIFDPFIDKALVIIHEDTAPGRIERLYADIHTLFDIFKVLIKHGVFSNSDMHDQLLANLARDGTVGELIAVLEANESMKALIPEITHIGVAALGSALGDMSGEFDHVMENVAAEVNQIKAQGTPEEQKQYVTDILHTELEREGMILEDAVIDKYAQLMVDELITPSGDEDITTEDILIFFADNAWQLQEDIPGVDIPTDGSGDIIDQLPDGIIGENVDKIPALPSN